MPDALRRHGRLSRHRVQPPAMRGGAARRPPSNPRTERALLFFFGGGGGGGGWVVGCLRLQGVRVSGFEVSGLWFSEGAAERICIVARIIR